MREHVLYTAEDFKHLSSEEQEKPYTIAYYVTVCGFNICKLCGKGEGELSELVDGNWVATSCEATSSSPTSDAKLAAVKKFCEDNKALDSKKTFIFQGKVYVNELAAERITVYDKVLKLLELEDDSQSN